MVGNEGVKLVYQPVPGDGASDVFAAALWDVVQATEQVAMVSPYLAGEVVKPIADGRDFRVITDVVACSEGGVDDSLATFFETHQAQIRSLRGLHAKVVLGPRAALLGSANLTRTALCKRFEMGCVVRGLLVAELWSWFESLWMHASPLDPDDIARITAAKSTRKKSGGDGARATAGLPTTGCLAWLTPSAPASVTAATDGVEVLPSSVNPEDLDELAARLAELTSDRQTAGLVLRMLRQALVHAGLSADDDRLHLNFSRQGRISITLGQRHVAWCRRNGTVREFGMMLQSFDIAERAAQTIQGARLDHYTRRKVPVVPELYVPLERLGELQSEVLDDWKRAIGRHVNECGKSSYRSKKRPALYDMLLSDELQRSIVGRAFIAAPED